jgi:hypothetical protein
MRMPDGPGLSPAGTWPARPPGRRRSSPGPGTQAAPVSPVTAAARQRPGAPPPHRAPPREVVLVGAHGGAGVTTLAGLLRPAWDLGVVRQPGPDRGPLRPAGRPVLLVARNTVAAAGRAVTAARLLDEQGVPVTVLVVIGDGLPEPAEARYRFRVLSGRVGAVVRVPFVPALRIAADPLSVDLPRRARRALAEIRALAHEPVPYPASAIKP